MMTKPLRLRPSLLRCESGIAFVEFAYSLPIFLALSLAGLELTNFVTTRMRVNQMALHLADHASRMGEGDLLAAQTISERQINDAFAGVQLQGGNLDLLANGRIILSSLEWMASPTNPATPYRIAWQRCRGSLTHASAFGAQGDQNLAGIGPATRRVTAPVNSATMFVEIRYRYQPILSSDLVPELTFTEVASMTVRDTRDFSQIYNVENATPSTCA